MSFPREWLTHIYGDVLAAVRPLYGTAPAAEVLVQRADGDVTRHIDRVVERLVLDRLHALGGFHYRVFSEESPPVEFGRGPRLTVLLDPVDNTALAARGLPLASVAMAVGDAKTGQPVAALIGRLADPWCAYADREGVWLDGRPVRCATTTAVADAAIACYAPRGKRLRELAGNERLSEARFAYNCGGYLEMAYVACGLLDAFVEPSGLPCYEYAAGAFIAARAGAVVRRADGTALPYHWQDPERPEAFVIAASAPLFEAITGRRATPDPVEDDR